MGEKSTGPIQGILTWRLPCLNSGRSSGLVAETSAAHSAVFIGCSTGMVLNMNLTEFSHHSPNGAHVPRIDLVNGVRWFQFPAASKSCSENLVASTGLSLSATTCWTILSSLATSPLISLLNVPYSLMS